MPIRILLVDDHSVVRQGLRMFLSLSSELEIVGELHPDVVLMGGSPKAPNSAATASPTDQHTTGRTGDLRITVRTKAF